MKEQFPILAVYLRTSLEDYGKFHQLTEESNSIQNQRNLLQNYIAAHKDLGSLYPVEYIDDGFTGTNTERPRFRDMIHDAQAGRIACILIKDLSRFGRDYKEVGDYLERVFPSVGVRVVAVNDGYDSADLTGTTGGIDIAFRNFIYESYSRDLSVKVRTAMRVRMEKGRFVNHTPYGYMKDPCDKHHMIPDPATAPIVREIFLMILKGKSTTEVARILNRRGVPTPAEIKRHKPTREDLAPRWSHTAVIRILQTYKYTGAMTNHTRESRHIQDHNQRRVPKSEWIVTEDMHEAIVTKEEFVTANALILHPLKYVHNPKGTADAVFYCGHCGRKLQRTHGNDIYFSCAQHKYQDHSPCRGIRWSRTDLERVLLPVYRIQLDLLGQKLILAGHEKSEIDVAAYTQRKEQIEKDIEMCEKLKIRLFEQYHDGVLNVSDFIDQKADLVQRQEHLRRERGKLEAEHLRKKQAQEQRISKTKQVSEYLTDASLSDAELIPYMYEAIDRVLVMDEHHLEVRWKFEDFLRDFLPGNEKTTE